MRHLIIAAVSTLTLVAGIGSASAWERSVTITTPYGTKSGSAEVYCFEGACYREAQITGVNGNTLKRSGMCVQASAGHWDCKGTVTGPQGNSRTRSVHVIVD
jgi:hypothetical protein